MIKILKIYDYTKNNKNNSNNNNKLKELKNNNKFGNWYSRLYLKKIKVNIVPVNIKLFFTKKKYWLWYLKSNTSKCIYIYMHTSN